MPCQNYKDALIEAAASGAEPQGDLRAHLANCASCRAVFEQEQSLFASIDADLHVVANSDVPVSLLPRVRASLDAEAAPSHSWITNWFALASAVVMVVAFFATRAVWRTYVVEKPVEMAVKTNVPPRVTPPPRNHNPAVAPPVEKNAPSPGQAVIAKSRLAPEMLVRGKTRLEVLVPRDQEVLLAEYAEQWHLHKRAPLLTQDVDGTIFPSLQVAQMQIDELDVKLLAHEKSQ